MFDLFDSLGMRSDFNEIMMNSKLLKDHADLMKTNPGIADWLKKRPITER